MAVCRNFIPLQVIRWDREVFRFHGITAVGGTEGTERISPKSTLASQFHRLFVEHLRQFQYNLIRIVMTKDAALTK